MLCHKVVGPNCAKAGQSGVVSRTSKADIPTAIESSFRELRIAYCATLNALCDYLDTLEVTC